ncbi:hypothetical protein FIV42_14810 [Persicimonas caeni]|uniref:GIY-YIG domain-containing protein n=1 Tax=Persicimonas caeni TaxID=2292766 RepID=A0A4Y6PUP5_PERCE|nr:exonuclease domain-containing protein [Persicimonas caeni]QDG51963.1 hypothetical protein FIV42_14810 [Persicimonas caeni]QED33184.1 hypothetical protein FRD00_14805 [Persicimonas caeni]
MQRLTELPVLAIDCQSTGASPKHGHLLELAWCRTCADDESSPEVASFVLELPDGDTIPRRIQRMTGIDDEAMAEAVPPESVWEKLRREAAETPHSVIHYARFERAFLDDAHGRFGADDAFPLDIVCTHAIARRLFSDLPRRGIRALAGYLGHTLPEQKRAGHHALATAWIWRQLVRDLRLGHGVETLDELRQWLEQTPVSSSKKTHYAIDRDLRLSLPQTPGVYRMLSKTSDVLYVGKATSLKQRVNTYFQTRRGLSERKLELVTQVWDLDVTTVPTPLEAALLETDEIKRHSPPYNWGLRQKHRELRFANADWTSFSDIFDDEHATGPLRSTRSLRLASALEDTGPVAEWLTEEAPEYLADAAEWLDAGVDAFYVRHGDCDLDALALVLWEEYLAAKELADEESGADDEAENEQLEEEELVWTDELVADALETALRRAHRACRRARWLCRLTDATIAWRPSIDGCNGRMIVLEAGEVVEARDWEGEALDEPPGHARTAGERKALFDLAMWDRLRVLTTELRRLLSDGREVRVRFDNETSLGVGELKIALALI